MHAVFEGLAALNARPSGLRYFSLAEIDPRRLSDAYLRWLPAKLQRRAAEVLVHGLMALKLWKNRSQEGVVLLEFFAAYGWLFYPLMLFYPKRFLVFFMWDQEFARQGGYRKVALRGFQLFLCTSRCVAVQTEVDDSCLPPSLRLPKRRTVVVPMPARTDHRPRLPKGARPSAAKLTLGVVGTVRRDKRHVDAGFTDILRKTKQWLEVRGCEVEVVFGVPMNRPGFEVLRETADFARLVDTSSAQAYEQCLSSLDILVTAFSKDGYFYRSSGVICDAVCSGVWVVCPDLPILRHQIEWPVPVGVSYRSSEEIPEAVERAWRMHREAGSDPHWEWIARRSPESVDEMLRRALHVRSATPNPSL